MLSIEAGIVTAANVFLFLSFALRSVIINYVGWILWIIFLIFQIRKDRGNHMKLVIYGSLCILIACLLIKSLF